MVYGKLLYNNIKEYTPKWFKTIPYAQTNKPTFKRLPQKVNFINRTSLAKSMWMGLRNTVGQFAWSWSLMIFGISFGIYYSMYIPFIAAYKYNNQDRTYTAAYAKEKTFKKIKEDEEALEAEKEAASAAAESAEQAEEVEETQTKSRVAEEEQEQSPAPKSSGVTDSEQTKTNRVSSSQSNNDVDENEDEDVRADRKKEKLTALVQKILEEQEKKKRDVARKQAKQAQQSD